MHEHAIPVLVVDDNVGFLRVVQAILESGEPAFHVHTVQSARDALAFLEQRPPFSTAPRPAFVVLDYHLPDSNAPEVLRLVRSHADLRPLPVLVLSQADWEEDENAARAAGASAFRVKPSRVRALRETVVSFWKEQAHGGDGSAD
jgi:CheY-like chemotaxis protein